MSDVQLYSFEKGRPDQPGVLCIHGLLGAGRNLSRLVDQLALHGFHAGAYDQRGHGHSPHTADGRYSLELLSDDVFKMMDHFKMPKAHLVGHSMGGRVALAACGKNPERVLSLTLMDVGVGINNSAFSEISSILMALDESFTSRQEAIEVLQRKLPALSTSRDQMIQFLVSNLRSDPAATSDARRMGWTFDLKGIRDSLMKAIDKDQMAVWRGLRCPVQVLRGEESKHFLQQELETMMKENPKAQFKVIPEAGHWLHVDNFHDTVDAVVSFIKRVSG